MMTLARALYIVGIVLTSNRQLRILGLGLGHSVQFLVERALTRILRKCFATDCASRL